VTWERAIPAFEQAVRDHHRARGQGEPTAATVATNGPLVAKRAENLIHVLEALTGRGTLTGLHVLEAGSGYGALAAYLAAELEAERVTGVDVRADLVESARAAAAEAGLDDRLTYRVADLRSLEDVAGASVDLAIANNSLLYLTTREDLDAALAALLRVLVPDGRVVIYQANLLRLSEPFSAAPLVHLLPARLAGAVARVTGWRHSHGRVRLVSPPGLARAMRRAGFADVRVGAMRGGSVSRSVPVGRFLAGAGRRPT
jgi:ubiquinone/menaquinone biosynthesis C-methylase UbiE